MPSLIRRLSSLGLRDIRQTPEKWRSEIVRIANGAVPVPSASDSFLPFPWAKLRSCTDSYLERIKLSQNDLDVVLTSLITDSDNQIVALAACAHLLSKPTKRELLPTFANDTTNPVRYFQALIAAYQWDEDFPETDRSWAKALVPICGGAALEETNLRDIVHQYNHTPLPSDMILCRKICQHFSGVLQTCAGRCDWNKAAPLVKVLGAFSPQTTKVAEPVLHIWRHHNPFWKGWASWQVLWDRLQVWYSIKDDGVLAPFWELIGPDLSIGYAKYSSLAERLVKTETFIQWLETKGLRPGPGLFFLDRSHMSMFIELLFEAIDTVCEQRGTTEFFFRHILNNGTGLDGHSLQLWKLATTRLIGPAPNFLEDVLDTERSAHSTWPTLLAGLKVLDTHALRPLRIFLEPGVRILVLATGERLRDSFIGLLRSDEDFTRDAKDLLSFRQFIGARRILGPVEIQGLRLDPMPAISEQDVDILHSLHTSIRRLTDLGCEQSRTFADRCITGYLENPPQPKILELFRLWKANTNEYCRLLALELAFSPPEPSHEISHSSSYDITPNDQIKCIQDVSRLTTQAAQEFLDHLWFNSRDFNRSLRVVQIITELFEAAPESLIHWRGIVCWITDLHDAISHIYESCSLSDYKKWITGLRTIYGVEFPPLQEAARWLGCLQEYESTLEILDSKRGSKRAMACILAGKSEPTATHLTTILRTLREQTKVARCDLMEYLVLSLTGNSTSTKLISDAMVKVSALTDTWFDYCRDLISMHTSASVYVAAVRLEVWTRLYSPDLKTMAALTALGKALGFPPSPQAKNAEVYYAKRLSTLMEKAKKLEALSLRLRRTDKTAAKRVFKKLGIEPTAPLEDELMDFPTDILNNIDHLSDSIVELRFPLSHASHLQRTAMGIREGGQLSVRLTLNPSDQWESFCVHAMEPLSMTEESSHTVCSIDILKSPHSTQCCDSGDVRLEYYISRLAWRFLKSFQAVRAPLMDIYKKVETALKAFGNNCIVCGVSVGADLYRPVVCTSRPCFTTFLRSSLDLRLADLTMDEPVLNLLLTSIHAVACKRSEAKAAGNSDLDLLPAFPDRLNDPKKLLHLMNQLPVRLSTFKTSGPAATQADIRQRLLLSYACNSSRGFLVSATGPLKVPNLPQVIQYAVVDNPPSVTSAFAQHRHVQPRLVFFHGTSVDRLYAILSQGLKVLSNTSLMTHAAHHGPGIYLATEPATALGYATSHRASPSPGTFAANHQEYVAKDVLLGVEYAGNDTNNVAKGIHVATDPTKLLLRYVFLVPPGYVAPVSQHVSPAMLSNFSTLSTGARK